MPLAATVPSLPALEVLERLRAEPTFRTTELRGKSYKKREYAENRLIEFREIIGRATCIVATNDAGRFVPVVVNPEGGSIGILIHNGITVLS